MSTNPSNKKIPILKNYINIHGKYILSIQGDRNLWKLIKDTKEIKLDTVLFEKFINTLDFNSYSEKDILYHVSIACRRGLDKLGLQKTRIVMIRYNNSKITFRTLKNQIVYPDIDTKIFEEEERLEKLRKEQRRLLLVGLYETTSWFSKEKFHFDIFREIYKMI